MKDVTATGAFAVAVSRDIAAVRDRLREGKVLEAEELFISTKAKLDRAVVSVQAEPLAMRLLALELVYLLLVLSIGYVTRRWPDHPVWAGFVGLHFAAAWFGGLGGVAVALYGIYSHVQARDFDPKYRLWYVCKPIMGSVFGWFVFLVYYVGLVSVQGASIDVRTPEVPYAIAFLAGFSERFTIRIIDRVMEIVTTWEEKRREDSV